MISIPKNIISFDCETTGLNPYGDPKLLGFYPARPFLFAFSNIEGQSESYRMYVSPINRKIFYSRKNFQQYRDILENPKISKIGHNIGFDILMSKMMGIKVQGEIHDTLALAHIATGGSELSYGLKSFCKKTMGFDDEDEKELQASVISARREAKKKGWCIAEGKAHGRDPIKADYWLGDKDLCSKYCIQDTERAMLVYLGLIEKINSNSQMKKIYEQEMKLLPITWRMEQRGVKLFPDKLKEITKFYVNYQTEQRKIADKIGGKGLNFNSPLQLQKHFFGQKKYTPFKMTKPTPNNPNGNPSTDGDSLLYFASKYKDKLAKTILEYNAADQMLTGFMEPYNRFKSLEKGNWILHPNFRQIGPVTGRYSASDPNLQQVAAEDSGRRKADLQMRPRECLGPRRGYVWYLIDYSQIEVWVLSFESEEKSLIELLLKGEDFHEGIAKMVWGEESDFEENKSHYRKRAKQVNFCKFYGGGIGKVAELLGCSKGDASLFVHDYDTKAPAISRFMRRVTNQMIESGKIVNKFGRHYFLPSQVAYKATNYIVQGTAADILKRAMINIAENIYPKFPGTEILLTLHDELIVEVPLEFHSKEIIREIVSEMQRDSSVIGCPIPLPVGVKYTTTLWSEAKELTWVMEEWKAKYINVRKNRR